MQQEGLLNSRLIEGEARVSTPVAVFAAIIGNGLEWYNFMLYGAFAGTVANLFFPAGNPLTSLLISLGTFGVAFFMRPIGGVLLGMYSDKVGRKPALTLTILLMCVGTAMIAFAPTYDEIGIAAPIIIVVARLIQGFSTGGEMGNATAFMREYAPPERQAYYVSWVYASIGLFVSLGLGVGTLTSLTLSPEALHSWGWRVPFLIGLLLGPVGYFVRTRIPDPPALGHSRSARSPLGEVLTRNIREVFGSGALVVLSTSCTYVITVYTPVYAVRMLGVPHSVAFAATMAGTLSNGCLTPVFGKLVDRFGPRLFLRTGAVLLLVLAYPMFVYVNAAPGLFSLFVFQIVFSMVTACYQGAILTGIANMLPIPTLATGLGLSDNVAVAIFGGSAAFIVTLLIAATGSNMIPAFYLMGGALIGLAGTLLVPPGTSTAKMRPISPA